MGIWPITYGRQSLSNALRDYQICPRCVRDTSDPEIDFDEAGICNLCKAYFVRAARELCPADVSIKLLEDLCRQISERGVDIDRSDSFPELRRLPNTPC